MVEIKIASVDTLILYFAKTINLESAKKVRFAYQCIKNAKLHYIKDITPSYTSILIHFDLLQTSHEELKSELLELLKSKKDENIKEPTKLISIPVLYDKEVGLDLEDVAHLHKLSIEDVIDLHVSREYLVYAIGFLPGFAYMGEVNPKLATPRLANPRAKLPKGSVGIADNQTATYPKQSPGGWRILGRTPINMFDLNFQGFSYLNVGDRVRYKPISKDEFLKLGGVYG